MRLVSPDEAVASIDSRQTVYVHGAAATSSALLAALTARAIDLTDVTTVGLHLEGPSRIWPILVGIGVFRPGWTSLYVAANVAFEDDADGGRTPLGRRPAGG